MVNKTPVTQEMQAKKTRKSLIIIVSIFASVALVFAAGATGGIIASMMIKNSSGSTITSISSGSDGNSVVTDEEISIASVAEKVKPSVVSVITQVETQSFFGTSFGEAAGTGIIVSSNGYIMTNNHVLEGANSVSIVNSDGKTYTDVEIVGSDPLNDIAFLKINSEDEFKPITIGNSATIRTGQQVVAIGNALGQYSNTVTSGIISGLGRPVTASTSSGATETLTDLVQTDASINEGNSGGPLVNMAGQVIGINTAIAANANGIGFAIPINSTKGILAGVIENGEVSRAYIGVNYLTITPEVALEYNLPVNQGAYIYNRGSSSSILSGGPADKAGLKDNDIITKINNEEIGANSGLSSLVGQYRPGEEIEITYIRDGAENNTKLTLGEYSN